MSCLPPIKKALSAHPNLLSYLQSNPPNVSLLGDPFNILRHNELRGLCASVFPEIYTIAQLCSFYGRTDHLKALLNQSSQKKELIKESGYKTIALAAMEGHLDTILHLETHLNPGEKNRAVKADDYLAMRWAAAQGHLAIIQHLETHLSLEEKADAAKSAMILAAKNGHLEVLQHLETWLNSEAKKAAVKELIYAAATKGHLAIVQYLIEGVTLEEKKAIFKSAINSAAMDGHLKIIQYMEEDLSNEERRDVAKNDGNIGIVWAAIEGHLGVVLHLEGHFSDEEKHEAAKSNEYRVIRVASQGGHWDIVLHLMTHLTPEEKKEVVKLSDYDLIQYAVKEGRWDIIQHLTTHLSPEEQKEAVKADNYNALKLAAKNGHRSIVQRLKVHLSSEEQKEAAPQVLQWAAKNGHLDIIKDWEQCLDREGIKRAIMGDSYRLIKVAAENAQLAIIQHFRSYLSYAEWKCAARAAISWAARAGHLEIIRYLEQDLSPNEKIAVIESLNYQILYEVAQNGHLAILQHLEKYLNFEDRKRIFKAYNYRIFQGAVEKDHFPVIQHLETYFNPEEQKEAAKQVILIAMINANIDMIWYLEKRLSLEEKTAIIRTLCSAIFLRREILTTIYSDHSLVAHYFLNFDIALAYAESHDWEYGQEYIYSFVTEKLAGLQERQEAYEQSNPTEVFDLPEEEARVCFYILRNLIRRGVRRNFADAEETSDGIRFLLGIPGVRNLCHQSLNGGEENELLRLANRLGNPTAASLLLQIPAVNSLAVANNFYASDREVGNLDLRRIAQDRESSMIALNESERKIVEEVRDYYSEKMLAAGGYTQVFQQLKTELKTRYEENPAKLPIRVGNGKMRVLTLPFEWEDLQKLRQELEPWEYDRALEAYYQHDVHTAYRYLSIPNYWMAPNASYVNVYYENGRVSPYRYSTFEDYIPLISLFYLAAKDEDMPATEGHTLESRIAFFIKQLADIGRAHCWDKSRNIIRNGKLGKEEYHDLTLGDCPSCYSGVNRRLFQAVMGHGLFQKITTKIIQQTISEQVRGYFKEVMADSQVKESIARAYQGLIDLEGDANDHLTALRNYDISSERKAALKAVAWEQLAKAYRLGDDRQSEVMGIMDNYFQSNSLGSPDFIYFDTSACLSTLLPPKTNSSPVRQSEAGVFRVKRARQREDSSNPSP